MAQKIMLAAILMQTQKVALIQQTKGGDWELPSGLLSSTHKTTEDGMSDILDNLGIATKIDDADFYATTYIQTADEYIVYNLYAPTNWTGEIINPTVHADWVNFSDLRVQKLPESVLELLTSFFEMKKVQNPTHMHSDTKSELSKTNTRRARGLDVLKTLQGDDPVEQARQLKNKWGDLADDIIDFALGEVWASPDLDRRTRSLITVGMTAALGGRPQALSAHLNGALNHGATLGEISATLRMVAVYAGFPAALEGWSIMKKVMEKNNNASPSNEEQS